MTTKEAVKDVAKLFLTLWAIVGVFEIIKFVLS